MDKLMHYILVGAGFVLFLTGTVLFWNLAVLSGVVFILFGIIGFLVVWVKEFIDNWFKKGDGQ